VTELINEIFDVGKLYTRAIENDQNVGEKTIVSFIDYYDE
jgi:hypothetical protein